MRTVSLPGTDLASTRLGFGTSGLHRIVRRRSRQDLLASVFDLGITHFDTSPFYGHGIAERELGQFARRRRAQLVLATKFGVKPDPLLARAPWLLYAQLAANAAQRRLSGSNRLAVNPARDYGPREARRSLERSLRTLGTDYVDVYFLHDANLLLVDRGEELLDALQRLRQEGKTRYVGLAGAAGDCRALAGRFPGMAQVMQIDAAPGARDAGQPESALTWHCSFGHFRNQHAPMTSLLGDAIRVNRSGVILYSSRRPTRVAETAALLEELDR